ncbi:MAG TPA: oxygen-independent coproporphyrinogen III oxidase [Rhodocyclaceae bacterium]|nr:oxygen-independent coproporphyrinogen III oxidase [Rhodocyclaceae bacterium]
MLAHLAPNCTIAPPVPPPAVFEPELIRRYDVSGPRYTSYPTADRFVEAYGPDSHERWLSRRGIGGASGTGLSVYLHIPFCDTVCYYCACNKVVTKDHSRSAKYLRHLALEMEHVDRVIGGSREILQLHMGGGTPTFLAAEEFDFIIEAVGRHFRLREDGEYSIEVDPRRIGAPLVAHLARLGFNRMSVGVQDFDAQVQKAVNRIQGVAETRAIIESARTNGFRSVSVDLIYGLPRQNADSFRRTLDTVLGLDPDRIALYNYAHLPQQFGPQRRINTVDLPSPTMKLDLLGIAVERMTAAGYVYIGMDHFARPDDDLAVAQRRGKLQRNFQGYSTHADCDLVGFGVSAISQIGPVYAQNHRTLDGYYAALEQGMLPIMRGIELSADDLLRRAVIQGLMCHFELSIEAIETAHLIDFRNYFRAELQELQPLQQAGLLEIDNEWISILPRGRPLVRAIGMVFDRYLREHQQRARYSKII